MREPDPSSERAHMSIRHEPVEGLRQARLERVAQVRERLADAGRVALVLGLFWMGVDTVSAQTIDAKALYQQHCAVCHGEQRTGAIGDFHFAPDTDDESEASS